ncbi:MAG: hypothetical protein GY711_14800 [bacterium]|nr:hypothetical protein [bacterium]
MDIALAPAGEIALTSRTTSADYPTTPNAYDSAMGAGQDTCLTFIDTAVPGPAGITYSTFIGGENNGGGGVALSVDTGGVVTLGGFTYSSDFPTTPGAYDTSFLGPAGFNDAFLLRLDPSQPQPNQQLVYSTFLGGEGYESIFDLTVDATGSVVATGFTGVLGLVQNSFPTTCGAYDTSFNGEQDGFIVYLSPSGNRASDLQYSTFLGGTDWENFTALDVVGARAPRVVATGVCVSTDFPTVNPYQLGQGGWDGIALQLELNPHTFCAAEPNSAGSDGALICGTGSVLVSANALTLSVRGLPPDRFGYFLMADSMGYVPNLGDGQGNLCLGSHGSRPAARCCWGPRECSSSSRWCGPAGYARGTLPGTRWD